MYEDKIQKRLGKLTEAIIEIAELAEKQRKYSQLNREIAQLIVGEPYYWGEWSGHVEAHSTNPEKVVVVLTHYKTGETVHWTFDATRAFNQVKESAKYDSYEAFREAEMIQFFISHAKRLKQYGCPEHAIDQTIREMCIQYRVDYNTFQKVMAETRRG